MRIGILKADGVNPRLQPEFGEYPAMITRVLKRAAEFAANDTLEFLVYDVELGEYPKQLADCDGYIITGSKSSVYDDVPWVHQLLDFVRALDASRTPTVGICFGHQLMAHALGGKAEPAAVGWRVGVHHAQVINTASFMAPYAGAFALLYSHKDQGASLPAGATVLATCDSCPNAMFQIGKHMLGLQGHPEFIKDYSKGLLALRRETLGESLYAAGMASLQENTDEVLVGAWILRFLADARAARRDLAVAGS